MVTGGFRCSLAEYIRDDLFKSWSEDRKHIENKWLRNWCAFTADVSGKSFWKAWKPGEASDWRSDVFIQLTRTKVVTAYSLVIDHLLHNGQIPVDLVPSPQDNIRLDEMNAENQLAFEKSISQMSKRMHQQFLDSRADIQLKRNVLSACLYGETYAKMIVHTVERKNFQRLDLAGGGVLNQADFIRWEQQSKKIQAPGWKYVPVYTVYRDLESEDLQGSIGIMERRRVSAYELRKKIGGPYYLDQNIKDAIAEDKLLNEYDDDQALPPNMRDKNTKSKRNIDLLLFWGRVPTHIVEAFETRNGKESVDVDPYQAEDKGLETEIVAEVAGDNVIRMVRAEPGQRPWCRVVWEERLDDSFGHGTADSIEDSQTIVNGAARAMLDNAALAANVILATKRRYLNTETDEIKPGMEIEVSEEVDDVRQAIQQVVINPVIDSLVVILQTFERFADDNSNIPRILQGTVSEKQKPDTAFEVSTLQQNAGIYIGQVIRNFDDDLIEQMANWFFEYDMLDPTVQEGKGNYIAKASGYTSFASRVERQQKMLQALQLTLGSEILTFEAKPRYLLEEIYQSLDIDPTKALKTDQEKTTEAQQSQMTQMQAQQLAMKEKLADIEETMAKTAKLKVQTMTETGRSDLNKAKAMTDIERVKTERKRADLEGARASADMLDRAAQIDLKRAGRQT